MKACPRNAMTRTMTMGSVYAKHDVRAARCSSSLAWRVAESSVLGVDPALEAMAHASSGGRPVS